MVLATSCVVAIKTHHTIVQSQRSSGQYIVSQVNFFFSCIFIMTRVTVLIVFRLNFKDYLTSHYKSKLIQENSASGKC